MPYNREYYLKNREHELERSKKRREVDGGVYNRAYHKKHYAANRERIIAGRKVWSTARRLSVLKLMGNKCVECGYKDPRALCIDHINNNGSVERKGIYNQTSFHKKLLELPPKKLKSEYQLLCANCNWIKRLSIKF